MSNDTNWCTVFIYAVIGAFCIWVAVSEERASRNPRDTCVTTSRGAYVCGKPY